MLNVMKMDLYHLFKSKTLYVTTAILTMYCVLELFILVYLPEEFLGVGASSSLFELLKYDTSNVFVVLLTFSGFGPIFFMGIFWSIFMSSDYSQGYIKNIAGQIRSRSILVNSKYVTMVIYSSLMYIWSYLLTLIIVLTFSKNIKFGFDAKAFFAIWFMYIGLMSLIFFVTYFSNRMILGIIVTFIIGVGLLKMGFMLIDYLIYKIFEATVTLEKGTITYYFEDYSTRAAMGGDIGEVYQAIIITAIFITISLVLSHLIFRKKDIVV